MGTSYVKYKNFGFWSRDAFLADWIRAMLAEIQLLAAKDRWLESLSEEWRIQAEIDGGCMYFGLDDSLIDEARRALLLEIARRVVNRCPERSKRTGDLFIALLSGQLTTTASSPIDYL
jgi:hypothetical protein